MRLYICSVHVSEIFSPDCSMHKNYCLHSIQLYNAVSFLELLVCKEKKKQTAPNVLKHETIHKQTKKSYINIDCIVNMTVVSSKSLSFFLMLDFQRLSQMKSSPHVQLASQNFSLNSISSPIFLHSLLYFCVASGTFQFFCLCFMHLMVKQGLVMVMMEINSVITTVPTNNSV